MEQRPINELFEQFNTSREHGLTSAQVAENKAKYGENALPKEKKNNFFKAFLGQLNNPMIYVLFIAALVSFVMAIIEKEGFFEPILILAIVFLNGVIGAVQELKADKALEALEKLSAPTTIVRRDGLIQEIRASELVPGDIVILEEGRTVPADLRLVTSVNLKASEASLTGESVPVLKDADVLYSHTMPIGDRKNMVYMSTPIVYGRGEGVVVHTGLNTEIGKIAKILSSTKNEETPLAKRLADLSKLLGFITLGLVVLLFVVALIREPSIDNIKTMFLLSISLAVAAIPEGLPAVVTITLALGVQKMVKVNTIVRRLPSVETLGAVSVVCSDKTGTLTQNKMVVTSAYINHETFDGTRLLEGETLLLAKGLSLSSDATIEDGTYGDPTEIALVEYLASFNISKSSAETNEPRIKELPFDSVRKMMSTLHQVDGKFVQYTKGALDLILKVTTHIEVNGVVKPLTAKDKEQILKASEQMASKALRVLALAKKMPNAEFISEDNLIFVGFVGMVDPPRPEAKEAVASLKKAGIKTIMVTGDHKDTAYAIASELGIASNESEVMSGAQMDELSEEALIDALHTKRVFARVSPENKVQIVRAFQANDEIVAMTGDGVNDAPSLKGADIGIAMGITGTDVAKGAADMVLSDDNFASIEKAVEEGRGIYNNVKKTVWFLLSSNIGEVLTMLAASLVGYPFPLTALHILWVNLITDSLPALALGSEGKNSDVMEDKPRPKKESLFAGGGYGMIVFYGFIIALMTTLAFLYVPLIEGGVTTINGIGQYFTDNIGTIERAETFAFTVLGVSQLFHMFGMSNRNRSFFRLFRKDKWFLWAAFFFGFVLQVAVTEIGFLTRAFGTVELTFIEWVFLALFSTIPLVIHELRVLVRFIIKKIKKQ